MTNQTRPFSPHEDTLLSTERLHIVNGKLFAEDCNVRKSGSFIWRLWTRGEYSQSKCLARIEAVAKEALHKNDFAAAEKLTATYKILIERAVKQNEETKNWYWITRFLFAKQEIKLDSHRTMRESLKQAPFDQFNSLETEHASLARKFYQAKTDSEFKALLPDLRNIQTRSETFRAQLASIDATKYASLIHKLVGIEGTLKGQIKRCELADLDSSKKALEASVDGLNQKVTFNQNNSVGFFLSCYVEGEQLLAAYSTLVDKTKILNQNNERPYLENDLLTLHNNIHTALDRIQRSELGAVGCERSALEDGVQKLKTSGNVLADAETLMGQLNAFDTTLTKVHFVQEKEELLTWSKSKKEEIRKLAGQTAKGVFDALKLRDTKSHDYKTIVKEKGELENTLIRPLETLVRLCEACGLTEIATEVQTFHDATQKLLDDALTQDAANKEFKALIDTVSREYRSASVKTSDFINERSDEFSASYLRGAIIELAKQEKLLSAFNEAKGRFLENEDKELSEQLIKNIQKTLSEGSFALFVYYDERLKIEMTAIYSRLTYCESPDLWETNTSPALSGILSGLKSKIDSWKQMLKILSKGELAALFQQYVAGFQAADARLATTQTGYDKRLVTLQADLKELMKLEECYSILEQFDAGIPVDLYLFYKAFNERRAFYVNNPRFQARFNLLDTRFNTQLPIWESRQAAFYSQREQEAIRLRQREAIRLQQAQEALLQQQAELRIQQQREAIHLQRQQASFRSQLSIPVVTSAASSVVTPQPVAPVRQVRGAVPMPAVQPTLSLLSSTAAPAAIPSATSMLTVTSRTLQPGTPRPVMPLQVSGMTRPPGMSLEEWIARNRRK